LRALGAGQSEEKVRKEVMNSYKEKKIGTRRLRAGAVLNCVIFLAAFGAVLVSKAMAQTVAVAEVTGYVTDPTGGAVAGAQVTMTEIEKHQIHKTTTDSKGGRYSFPNLDVGTYNLTVSSTGFKEYVQSHIVLQVASNIGINVQLEVGVVTETVEVRSDSTMIETKDNSIAQVIDSRRVVDLPLNGRNPTQIILLTGAATAPPVNTIFQDLITSKNIGGSNGSGTFSIAGGQANGVNYLLDGGDNNDPIFNVNLPLPFPDAIQEFRGIIYLTTSAPICPNTLANPNDNCASILRIASGIDRRHPS
jgi:Carboxypeptidase regulatory-like domain